MSRQDILGITNSSSDTAMLESIYHQYPAFRPVYGNNFTLQNVTSKRRQAAPDWTTQRQSEFYFPNDMSSSDQLPHPDPGKFALEFYNKDAINNPEIRRSLTVGEMLHGMVQDPKWMALRQDFFKNFSPQTDAINRNEAYPNEKNPGETYDQTLNRTLGDAYIRAGFLSNPSSEQGLSPPSYSAPGDYWNNTEWLNGYSPKQFDILSQMKQYLQTPQNTDTNTDTYSAP